MVDSIVSRARAQAEQRPNAPAYYVRGAEYWEPTAWSEYWREISGFAKSLLSRNFGKGDSVCILGFNRPEWVIADVGTMAAGGIPAGIYTTNSPTEVQYIASHCGAKLIVVENREQFDKVSAVRDELPELEAVVLMKGCAAIDDDLAITWDEFLREGESLSDETLDLRIEGIRSEDIGTLIYTSGTTGPPKAVMLTHDTLAWTADTAKVIVSGTANDVLISYLPLSHIAEQMFSVHGSITIGYPVYYAQSIDALPDNLKEVRPTIFFGVPRIWEKFHAGISSKLAEATGVKAKLAGWAQGVGRRVSELKVRGEEPTGALAMQYKLAYKLIFSKLRAAIGLDRTRVAVSGAAPLAPDIINFFADLDIIVHEVYGQSEDCGPTTFNLPGDTRIGSVGKPVPGVDVRLGDDDEILVRGRNVFAGYLNNQDATDETLIDGWLHSGDLGRFDEDGFLFIIGRKKDIIITAGGKNIAPRNIEEALKQHNMVSEAVVIGDRRKFISALITLDLETMAPWAAERGVDPADLHQSEEVRALIQGHVDDINKNLAQVEKVKKFHLLSRNLSVETGELTPTLKVKRRIVHANFSDEIDSMYK